MKLYTKTILATLPDWATIVTQSADLFEVEINEEHPNFQSLLEELTTEIEPGTIGVKSKDLCSRLGFDLSSPNLCQLLGTCPNSDISYCYAPRLRATAGLGIHP